MPQKAVVRKKVDSRVRVLIENGVKLGHRTLFVIVGDSAREQVVNLHYILSMARVDTRPSVLWCYNKDLGFTTHRKKRAAKLKRDIARGIREVDEQNPFELFVACTDIRYCYYRETHKILGSTYGMCVLQDFEALTPNLLARTIETVSGGGLVLLMLKSMKSLTQLYTMVMDVHKRYRTHAHKDVVARFNERFMLSLGRCDRCLVLDDELNILPISSKLKKVERLPNELDESEAAAELKEVQEAMSDTPPAGPLVARCRTLDQARAVLTFIEAISEKALTTTVSMTAARGRGKSAALGLAMAAAVAYGYSNIFVTSPSPENLKTVFEMVLAGFDALEYKEHQDYEIVQSTNPDFNRAIVRVNVFRAHRQTIQYIQPRDAQLLAQAELLVIDEAAAIPLPVVRKLMGAYYLCFLSSTINGYEGTGRSLSLKLLKSLRGGKGGAAASVGGGRTLKEVTLAEPIRYRLGDPVEGWLNGLLCLDCADSVPELKQGVPHPSQCELYHVNRDTLFSYHRAAEVFLQRMMALYVASHYKNTPNDLQLMSDAPAHRLFVLLGPVKASGGLPDILCVLQVALEGGINRASVQASLARGKTQSGDLLPWVISQQFQDNDFPSLSGARVVRIAVHPKLQRMGYGSRAIELLAAYYSGDIISLYDDDKASGGGSGTTRSGAVDRKTKSASSSLLEETVAPRGGLKPMLEKLAQRPPEPLHYLGVSFGLTLPLFSFWERAGYTPVYLRQTQNELTGEHTCIMLKPLPRSTADFLPDEGWLDSYSRDFRRRYIELLGRSFVHFEPKLSLSIFHAHDKNAHRASAPEVSTARVTAGTLDMYMTKYDLKRLESYARNLVDYHLVLDLIPMCARLYFSGALGVKLSYSQSAILMCIGLQRKTVKDVQQLLGLENQQVLALFNKSMRKISKLLRSLEEAAAASTMKSVQAGIQQSEDAKSQMKPVQAELGNELSASGYKAVDELREKQRSMLGRMDLKEFAVQGTDDDWERATQAAGGAVSGTVAIKSAKPSRKKGGKKAKGSKKKKKERLSGGGSAKKRQRTK